MTQLMKPLEGILLIDKEADRTSFSLVHLLRKLTHVKKIGHAGTLDPFATGLLILLIGKKFTTLSGKMIDMDKEYEATVFLGKTSTTYDPEGPIEEVSSRIPTLEEILETLKSFQGTVEQIPPMFSAKKIQGKKLYNLARKGITVDRKPILVTLKTEFKEYCYPFLKLTITCTKGTYIRSIAHDLGQKLQVGAYLYALKRTRIGHYHLSDALVEERLKNDPLSLSHHLLSHSLVSS